MFKYYEMDVTIHGKVLVPVSEFESKDKAIEYTEMSEVQDIAYQISQNNNRPCFVLVNKNSVKEIEY
ncbi:hypothetical protein [Clostridium neonatale]|uniref:hypothetical protein n=1 Tax=Clostridium neonatale TaxID=137838 RepID=UPI00291B3B50|nr:hypothetical protein CNEO4_250084 [Clostridium neonatale]